MKSVIHSSFSPLEVNLNASMRYINLRFAYLLTFCTSSLQVFSYHWSQAYTVVTVVTGQYGHRRCFMPAGLAWQWKAVCLCASEPAVVGPLKSRVYGVQSSYNPSEARSKVARQKHEANYSERVISYTYRPYA